MDAARLDATLFAASRVLSRRLTLTRVLTGGQHAVTLMASDGDTNYVIRTFDPGDDAADRESAVLSRLPNEWPPTPLVLARGEVDGRPMIVTTALPGGHPDAAASLDAIAVQMATALAAIHRLDGTGLREEPHPPPAAPSPLSARAHEEWARLDVSERVLTHFDFWCGNALWHGPRLVGLVDWSGARSAPRGVDIAWCRQDLVLLGSRAAADIFLQTYVRQSGHDVPDVRAWDVLAAARADAHVESWEANYRGIGRDEITEHVLRERFDAWVRELLR